MAVHHRHLRTTAAALVVGLLVLLSGCNEDAAPGDASMGGPASSTASPEADPLAGAPSVDACYKMNIEKTLAATNNSNPVECYSDHTTLTYYVGTFPDDAVEPDPDVMAKECGKRLGKAMGLSKKQLVSSIFETIYFEPTTTQWSSGARWYRCDARAESGGKLRLLPSGSTPVLYDGVPDEFTRCVDNRNGQGLYVTCNKRARLPLGRLLPGQGRQDLPRPRELPEAGQGLLQVHRQRRLLGHLAAGAPLEHRRPRHELLQEDDRLTPAARSVRAVSPRPARAPRARA